MTLALWLVIYALLLFALGRLYESAMGWKTAGLIFYPGMLVAALGRMLASLAGKHEKVDVMRRQGPSQQGQLPSSSVFRILWAVGPVLSSLVVFLFVWHLLEQPIGFGGRLPRLAADAGVIGASADTLSSFLSSILDAVLDQRLGDWRWWVFLYAGAALTVASAPSKDDLVSVLSFAVVVGLSSFLLGQAGIHVAADGIYRGEFWGGFSFLVAISLLVLVLSTLLLLPPKLLRRSGEK